MSLTEDINLKHRSELYGFLSLWLMVFHLDMFFKPLLGSIHLHRIASLGDCCVDVFLFISGYCIYYSWAKVPDYLKFIKKRVLRIIPSYLIIAIPFFLWQDHFNWDFLYDVSGASFLVEGRLEAWFPVTIISFYLISPLLIRLLSGRKGIWVLLGLILITALLINSVDYFAKTGIMWSRLPAYAAGLYCASLMDKRECVENADKQKKSVNWIKLLLYSILLIVLAVSPILGTLRSSIGMDSVRLFSFILVIPALYVFNFCMRVTPGFLRHFLSFCGGLSLEIYLIHLFLLYVLAHYGLNVYLYPAALMASIPLAYIVRLLTGNAPRLAHHRAQ